MCNRAEAGPFQELLIDVHLSGGAQIVGHLHHDHAILQRFGFLVGQKFFELGLVGVGDDELIGIDQREAAGLDVLLLGEREEDIEKALVGLEHLDELNHAAVGDVELAVEAIRPRVGFRAEFADGGQIDAAHQLRDVLTLGIRRHEGADGRPILFRKEDALDRHAVDVLVVFVPEIERTHRAQLPLDVDAIVIQEVLPQRVRDEMQGIFMLWTIRDGIDGAAVGMRRCLQAAFEQDRQLTLAG